MGEGGEAFTPTPFEMAAVIAEWRPKQTISTPLMRQMPCVLLGESPLGRKRGFGQPFGDARGGCAAPQSRFRIFRPPRAILPLPGL